jgi:hypothetical protein
VIDNFPGAELELGQFSDIQLKPDSSIRILAKIRYTVPPDDTQKNREFQFRLTPLEGKVKESVIIPSHFITP